MRGGAKAQTGARCFLVRGAAAVFGVSARRRFLA